MLEKNVEDELRREAKRRGVWALKAEKLCPGFPDRLLLAPRGRFALVELKRPGINKLRTAQRLVKRWLRALDIHVHVLNTKADVQRFFREWLD